VHDVDLTSWTLSMTSLSCIRRGLLALLLFTSTLVAPPHVDALPLVVAAVGVRALVVTDVALAAVTVAGLRAAAVGAGAIGVGARLAAIGTVPLVAGGVVAGIAGAPLVGQGIVVGRVAAARTVVAAGVLVPIIAAATLASGG